MTRIVLLGRNGQVGWELERALFGLGEVVALGRVDLDFSDAARVTSAVQDLAPDVIVNAAAYTDVEGAESHAAEAFAINADAVAALAQAGRASGALLVHFSTDYVFDGAKTSPYQENDPTGPLNVYGQSKLAGEAAIRAADCAHVIFRTSWVYAARGRNFLRSILRLAGQRSELRVVDDQVGAPTSARLIAQVTALALQSIVVDGAAAERVRRGATVHLAARGETSWFGFAEHARALSKELGISFGAEVLPIPSSGYPTAAKRPQNSRLSLLALERDWRIEVPTWQTCLRLCLEEIAKAGG